MPRLLPLAAALLSFCTLGTVAKADGVRVWHSADEPVEPSEVARILDKHKIKMRSLRLLDSNTPSAIAAQNNESTDPSALSLPVPFAFDSAEILPQAKPQLDAIAAGIRLLPETQKVVIEGHTDALGPDRYNDRLSQRRALSVRRYLISMHGIDGNRLDAVGLGEYSPLPGHDPNARENRRVQFRGE